MRTLLVVFCALLMMNFSLEAKKKMKMAPSQKTHISKQHRTAANKIVKSHKAPKHRQSVN